MGLARFVSWIVALSVVPLGARAAPPEGCSEAWAWTSGGSRLGVRVQPMTPELREYFRVGDEAGVLVVSVEEESPAHGAGIRVGDVVTAVDGEKIARPHDLVRAVWSAPAEATVEVDLVREGDRTRIQVKLRDPEPGAWGPRGRPPLHPEHFGPGFGPQTEGAFRMLRERLLELERRIEELERELRAPPGAPDRT